MVFAKEVPDPENFGVIAYGDDGGVADIVEKAGRVDTRYDAPPSNDAVVGLYCYPPDVFDIIDGLAPSSRGELEITDVNRVYAQRGDLEVRRVEGWWHDGGKHWGDLADVGRLIERDGRKQVIDGIVRVPLAQVRGRPRVVLSRCAARASCRPGRCRRTSRSPAAGTIRGLHYHERGQDDLFACLQGTARVVVLDRATGETFTEDIGDDNPVAIYIPGIHAHGFEALTDLLFCYHVTARVRRGRARRAGRSAGSDPRVKHLWSTETPILSPRDAAACS